MGLKLEFNIRISEKLVREINEQASNLGIKRFEYSSEYGLIEFNDDVTQTQANQVVSQFKDRLIRRAV